MVVLEESCCLENTWRWGKKDKGQVQEVYTTKSRISMKGKDGHSAWQEAWVELQSGALYLTSWWKTMWPSIAWFDAKKFAAWCQINHLPVVWWSLRYFFACRRPSSSCEHPTSLKHTRLCLFTLSSLYLICFRLILLPILWISLCIFWFLETYSPWKAKLQWIFFPKESAQALWNHVVFCTVTLCPIKCHLSLLLYGQPEQTGRRGTLCYH